MGRVANHTSYRNSVMHGENISIQCTRNFELEGNVTQITCNNGTFDRMPKCEPGIKSSIFTQLFENQQKCLSWIF